MPRTTPRRRNLFTHLTAAVVVPGCIVLFWWQVTRALSGNTLSWAYVFEWPIFAGYAVFMWWKLIHEPAPGAQHEHDRRRPGTSATMAGQGGDGDTGSDHRDNRTGAPVGAAHDDEGTEEDEELASYNRYLAALHASGKRKQW